MITVTLKNGEKRQFPEDVTYYDISKKIKFERPIMGVKINNEVVSMNHTARDGDQLDFFDVTDLDGYKMYKSAVKMIFELAVKRVLTDAEVSYDHSVPKGLLGTIHCQDVITSDEINEVKQMMRKIVSDNLLFKKLNVRTKEAIQYFTKINQLEKAENVNNIADLTNTLFQLDTVINYYYSDMPYSTGCIEDFDMVYLGDNKFVFLWPSARSQGQIPEYIHHSNIIEAYVDGKAWLESLKIPYVADLNKVIEQARIKEFINSSEIVFNLYIARIANHMVANPDIKFILIAGPSSSGKTTSCKRLSEYLSALGYNPIRISTDDYYVNRDLTPKDENGNYDFECLEAIDVPAINEDVAKLLNHEKVNLPIYNFVTGEREKSDNIVELGDKSIFIMEGLHCLNPKIIPEVEDKYKYKVYLSPFIPLSIDRHNYVSSIDLRLIRRIVRDNRDRGSKVSNTIKSWESVRNGEEKYIFPFIQEADVIINTALAYELGVLKVYVEPLLHSVGIDSPYYEEAQRLLDFLKPFFPIPGDYVNSNSILREFIGGRSDG
jgi:uridine kinase